MSEPTSASNRTPAKDGAGIQIGMPRSRSQTNDVLIPQLALLVSVRTSSAVLIIMDPTGDVVNGGEFECPRITLLMLISITQRKEGTSPELTSTQAELPQETEPTSGRRVTSWVASGALIV